MNLFYLIFLANICFIEMSAKRLRFSTPTSSSIIDSGEKVHVKVCMCLTNWCGEFRMRHLLSTSTVCLPIEVREKEIWLNHLQVNMGDESNNILSKDRPRVWVGHFPEIDLTIISDDADNVSYDGIDFDNITKFSPETGNNSRLAPPRPSVTKAMILSSIFLDKKSLAISEYRFFSGADISSRRKRINKTILPPEQPAAIVEKVIVCRTPQSSEPKCRVNSTLYHENFIGVAHNLIDALKAMNDHGRLCTGNLNIRRSDCHTNRFTLMLKLTCSMKRKKGGECTAGWEDGMYKFQSVPNIEISPGRLVPVTDVLYVTAATLTPTTMAHADQMFVAMQLTPPSRNLYKEIRKLTAAKYLETEKERLINMACTEAKDLGVPISVCMDCGHSSSRNSEAATLAIASGNRIIGSLTDTKNSAYHKEAILVEEALDLIINVKKLDVVSVDIDDNAQNAKMITAYNRVNGPEDTKDEPVRCGLDIFHAIKALGKNALKRLIELLKLFLKHFKHFSEKKFSIENIIESLLTSVVSKSKVFFEDISKSFESHGAVSWKAASESPTTMNAFAIENNLMDKVPPRHYWDPVVTAWNLTFVKDNVTSVSRIKIKASYSIKSLKLLAEAVSTATGNVIPTTDKETEKDVLFQYMKKLLPDQCFRGTNFSVDIADTLLALEKQYDESPPLLDVAHIDPDEKIISSIFGDKNRTMKEVRLLKVKEMRLLSDHIASKMENPPKLDAKSVKSFCILNFWRLNNLCDDVSEAILIAQKAFSARIGEFKRTIKNLLRVVNDQYGSWSMKFRMMFLIHGLQNFIQHFCNNHTNCARWFWWVQCYDCRTKYMPMQAYCTEITSNRGPSCNKLIPLFFELLVTTYVMSEYCEKQFWKCLDFSKTTICESYFHWLGIMIPKWQHVTGSEYMLKERAAFIAFFNRQRNKMFLLKRLVKSKYANTLTVSSAQKNSRHEIHVLDAIREICKSCPVLIASVDFFTKKYEERQHKRQLLLANVVATFESNETAMNLGLGPGELKMTEYQNDGNAVSTFKESVTSARPVCPYPFLNENLLNEDQMYRIQNVWESTRNLKRQRENDENDDVLINSLCSICNDDITDDNITCSKCDVTIHLSCFQESNTEWIMISDDYICNNCKTL